MYGSTPLFRFSITFITFDDMSCETYTQACKVPACIDTLILGTVEKVNHIFYAFIEKMNGSVYIQQVESNSQGQVSIDLSDPDKSFYTQFDGLYLIHLVDTSAYGYFCPEDMVEITSLSNLEKYTQIGFSFKSGAGIQSSFISPLSE